jgi:hypothetical protein
MYLVVFNQTSWAKTASLSVSMREMDGTGSVMINKGDALKGVLLDYRWHTYPDKSYINYFDLIDETTGAVVPYDLAELNDAFEPVDFAPQRAGLGQGTKRYGFFEEPVILKYDICFIIM